MAHFILWHLRSTQARQDIGRARREQASKAWHDRWISKTGLKARLWTDKAIA